MALLSEVRTNPRLENLGDFSPWGRSVLQTASPRKMSTSDKTQKVQNWSEYNEAFVDRGRLTVWISEEAIEGWKHEGPPQQWAQ